MTQTRRRFLKTAAVTALAGALDLPVRGLAAPRFRAVAFDAFPILDPRPIAALADELFPGRGAALMEVWRTRQFEYAWLRSMAQRYVDFWQVTEESLTFAAATLDLPLDGSARGCLMAAYLELRAWPDVLPALTALRAAGVQLAFLSNFTPAMLAAGMRNSGLERLFAHTLSTDLARTFKPDPRAYALALDAFKLPREQILFAPFAGWDAAGAKWFGYPTFWVNRLQSPPEQLGADVDASGPGLADLARYALTPA